MSRMIRKQVYLDESQQRKLTRLAEAGLLAPPPPAREPRLGPDSVKALEQELAARAAKRSAPLGLAAAFVEDRR